MEKIIAALSSNHLLFIFSIIFILIFHKPISIFIQRITKIGKGGLTAGLSPESQREKIKTSAEAVQHLLDLVGNSIVINEYEKLIKKDLTTRGLSADGDVSKVLIKHLAGTQLLLALEKIHSSIFGSQIFLLKKLNEVVDQGRTQEYVNDHIEHVKKLYSDNLGDWSSEQYLKFLHSQSLITSNQREIHITDMGVEYLTWIAKNGKTENNLL